MSPRTRALLVIPLLALLAGCAPTANPSPSPTPNAVRTSSPRPSFFDRGSQQYATGSARLVNGAYRYVVATAATGGGIARRFGVNDATIAAASRGGYEIYQGDVLRIPH